jgi:hypothetical protein
MIKIGYCPTGAPNELYNILVAHPAFHPKREEIPVGGRARKCPSFNDYVLSAFNIYTNYDMRFRVKKTPTGEYFVEFDEKKTTISQQMLGEAMSLADIEDGVIQLSILPFWMFISDVPGVIMTVQGAQQQTNPDPIRGQLNIYDWWRGTAYAFKASVDEWITISKNSPIYQVKFYHPEETHFTVGEIHKTEVILRRENFGNLHNLTGPQKWKEIWAFNRHRRPKSVLNFIKDD